MSENSYFEQDLTARINKRKEAGLLRSLMVNNHLVDFCSNDYIGFSQHPNLYIPAEKSMPSGATGSRLISGNCILAEETEELIAKYHDIPAALIFNTGYMANVGLLSCLPEKDDTYIYDELVHASMIDGMRLSLAKRYKFKHNSLLDLEQKLRAASGSIYVVVESIYSMDGDAAPLINIAKLCKQYKAALIVDEAHAVGIFGKDGKGLVNELGLEKIVFARIITFGKALGLHGAAVLGSKNLREYMINFARSFIYTTALPPHYYIQIQEAYKLLPQANRKKLFSLISVFKDAIKDIAQASFIDSPSPIQGIVLGDNNKAVKLAKHLKQEGFFTKAILSPTVAKGTERLRICLHSYNTEKEISKLVNEIQVFLK